MKLLAAIIGWSIVTVLLISATYGLVQKWRGASRAGRWSCAILGGALLAWISARAAFQAGVERNPPIQSEADLAGKWESGAETLALEMSGTFRYETHAETVTGKWRLDGSNLRLTNEGYARRMAVIQYRGQYRLLTKPPWDLDAWDGWLGLERKEVR